MGTEVEEDLKTESRFAPGSSNSVLALALLQILVELKKLKKELQELKEKL